MTRFADDRVGMPAPKPRRWLAFGNVSPEADLESWAAVIGVIIVLAAGQRRTYVNTLSYASPR